MRASDWVRYGLAVVVVAAALVGPPSSGDSASDTAETADVPADTDAPTDTAPEVESRAARGVPWDVESVDQCDVDTVAALSGRHRDVDQFVVIVTGAFDDPVGDTFVAARRDDGWVCQTDRFVTRLGRHGTTPLADRRFGDETTPAGVFPLGEIETWDGDRINAFGVEPDPGVRSSLTYREVHEHDCWGSTPGARDYNHFVYKPVCDAPDEWLAGSPDIYEHAVIIGANLDPDTGDTSGDADDEPPYAAATFLHRHHYHDEVAQPTRVGASLSSGDLETVITLIDPELDPHFAIGPIDWLRDPG